MYCVTFWLPEQDDQFFAQSVANFSLLVEAKADLLLTSKEPLFPGSFLLE